MQLFYLQRCDQQQPQQQQQQQQHQQHGVKTVSVSYSNGDGGGSDSSSRPRPESAGYLDKGPGKCRSADGHHLKFKFFEGVREGECEAECDMRYDCGGYSVARSCVMHCGTAVASPQYCNYATETFDGCVCRTGKPAVEGVPEA